MAKDPSRQKNPHGSYKKPKPNELVSLEKVHRAKEVRSAFIHNACYNPVGTPLKLITNYFENTSSKLHPQLGNLYTLYLDIQKQWERLGEKDNNPVAAFIKFKLNETDNLTTNLAEMKPTST